MVAAALATMRPGNQPNAQICAFGQDEAAGLLNVGAAVKVINVGKEFEIRVRRRMGAELKKIDKAKGGGDNRKKHPSREGRGASPSTVPTLSDIGIPRQPLSRFDGPVGWGAPIGAC